MYRFKGELNQFFGEENWEYVDKESKSSPYVKDTIRGRGLVAPQEIPERYHNWTIRFHNKYGEEEYWRITDHTLKINNDNYGIFNSKRYSKRQAFYQELMYLSFYLVGREIYHEVIREVLTENEANIFDVSISFGGGRPGRELYSYLANQPWFTVEKATAEHYLTSDIIPFYIDIVAFDYRLEKLTLQEQQNVIDSLEKIEKLLLERYGGDATFSIYINEEYKVRYKKGEKQTDWEFYWLES